MLNADLERERAAARAIVDEADKEGRPMSDVEMKAAEGHKQAMISLKSKIEAEKVKQDFRNVVDDFNANIDKPGGGANDPHPVREPASVQVKSMFPGDALIATEQFRGWQAATKAADGKAPQYSTPPVMVPYPTLRQLLRTKAAGDPVLESDMTSVFGDGSAVPYTTFGGLETPGFVQFRLTIEDLLTTVPVTIGNSATYPIVDTRTPIDDTPQTEGDAKPGGEYKFDMVTVQLQTMAGWVKLSTQFLEDAPGLAAYVNADLPLQVRQNVETYLAGELQSAAAGNSFDGTGIGGTNGFDAILEAITAIQTAGGDPNGLVVTPADWAALRVLKNTGGDENYIGGGPFTPTDNPWNLRVVITPKATTGSPIVGDFARGAKVYRKGGLSVASTNSDQDDFITNKVTIRAETRLVIGVTYPEFFAVASIGTS